MSTGPIKDLEKQNNIAIEGLRRRQSREIKAIENSHQNVKAEQKKNQEADLVNFQWENQRHLASEAEKKEKILSDMRTNLHSTQELTDKQLKALKDDSSKEKIVVQQNLALARDKANAENQLYLEELNDRYQNETKKTNFEGKSRIASMTNNMNEQYADNQSHLQKKINDQSMAFSERFNREALEHKKLKDEVDKRNKSERIATNQRQQFEMSKMTEAHNTLVEVKGEDFKRGLKEQEDFFEKKYKASFESKSQDANKLDERYKFLMNKLKTDVASQLTLTEKRSSDPFFQFTELRPEVVHQPDGVEISIKIPDHSVQDLHLTTNIKEAILTFNRRYSDARDEGGFSNKVNKIETFTTKIATDHILNAKSVKAAYNNGVMTYTIKKA